MYNVHAGRLRLLAHGVGKERSINTGLPIIHIRLLLLKLMIDTDDLSQ